MKPLVTVAVLAGLAAPAAAASPKPPKIPAALAGVELRDDLVTVSVDKTPKRLGGLDVIVFRQTYRYKLAAEDVEPKGTATDLGIVDSATKDYLALVRIADHTPTGEMRYAPSWKDLNRDRDAELVLTRKKATGDQAFVAKKRILQVRHGRLVETTAELAACKKADDDRGRFGDDGPDPALVLERFVAAPTLCSYAEALVASRLELPEQQVPAKKATIAVSMPAADCPARAWAERHGRALPRRTTVAFLTAEGRLALASVDVAAGVVEPGTVDYQDLRHVEARTVEQHLYLLLEQKARATIFDPVLLKVVMEGETAQIRERWAAEVPSW